MYPYKVLGESRTPGSCTIMFIKAGRHTVVIGKKRPTTGIPGPITKPQIESLCFFAFVRHHDIDDVMTKPLVVWHFLLGRRRIDGAFWLTDPRIQIDRKNSLFKIPIGTGANDIEMNKESRRRSE